MNEQYKNMMEQMKLSESSRTAIEEKLDTSTKTIHCTSLRLGLAAACVSLVLMGGVFAAGQIAKVTMSAPQSNAEHSEFQVSVDLTLEDKKSFSEALVCDLENGTLQRAFTDRAELEEYLGFPLIHNDALETAGINEHLEQDFAHNWNLRPELAVAPDARYVLTATTYDNTGTDGFPEVLKISMHRVVENREFYIDARIITGSVDGQLNLSGEKFEPEPLIYSEPLRDENGQIMFDENGNLIVETTHYKSAEKCFYSESYVMANGIEATIITIETLEPWMMEMREEGKDVKGFCEYIAYFVHEGVVYSVRYWAVYDPTIPVNGSALSSLKHILDSFA